MGTTNTMPPRNSPPTQMCHHGVSSATTSPPLPSCFFFYRKTSRETHEALGCGTQGTLGGSTPASGLCHCAVSPFATPFLLASGIHFSQCQHPCPALLPHLRRGLLDMAPCDQPVAGAPNTGPQTNPYLSHKKIASNLANHNSTVPRATSSQNRSTRKVKSPRTPVLPRKKYHTAIKDVSKKHRP